ncbi:quinone-dependent dihydroorotate dehydrogenase [Marinihelvus fidelis]|uniref:Dihydroorotate dehydrogenase (quinone) n=1 Tax=Marinihelvus fidelis TaxID=2613842 RepID=A0A5N0TE15_9GAMM|nr:quinone-dependent dihydroorotate dehydrogenase [Marinihelvus fidelis]KAA9133282.1 quinone-dependent dihydroorotate dehydrogenase [Marinihelvus fidelis]
MFGVIRKALFQLPAEKAHELALEGLAKSHALGAAKRMYPRVDAPLRVMGLEFANGAGLAAGMDKNGDYIDALGDLGFGFIEVGTVTPRPQPGNPKPRIFRLEKAGAMINRLGFNNKGVDHLVGQVTKRTFDGVLGINIGKNFDTPNEKAVDDYLACFNAVYPHADYITVNISSPNTRGLRDLQGEEALNQLLRTLANRRRDLAGDHGRRVPIAVKVAPDLDSEAVTAIAAAVSRHQMDAVIATNTTISRDGVQGLKHAEETGGLSGRPLLESSTAILAALRDALPRDIALIGVGGIASGRDAAMKIRAGADLVQFYTGFVYRGPTLVAEAARGVKAARGNA